MVQVMFVGEYHGVCMSGRKLVKVTSDKRIAGVCAGIAQYTDIDVTLVRVGFIVAAVFGFSSPVLLYIILALVMPSN